MADLLDPVLQDAYPGSILVTLYSGALAPAVTAAKGAVATAGHVVLYSGAGRLNHVGFNQAISGVAANFYDAGIVARSGIATIQESGYPILYTVPANTWGGVLALAGPKDPVKVNVPFTSGLVLNYPSGVTGLTIVYTPNP